jgi:hypothetical protein
MQLPRIFIGIVVLLALAGAAGGGVWLLYEHVGGGLPIEIEFAEDRGLAPADPVIYGDRVVGRIERVTRGETGVVVHARITAEHAVLAREGSRFWVETRLGSAILHFDRVRNAGPVALPGHRYKGLAARPEPDPDLQPAPLSRPLRARPVWMCAVRTTLTTRLGDEQTLERNRKGAGAIVHASAQGDLLILCPAWLIEPAGPLIAQNLRVDLLGEGTRIAQLVYADDELALLFVARTSFREKTAALWPDELADGQGLVLADAGGNAYAAEYRRGGLEFRGSLSEGNLALIDGLNLAGFALPAVGAAIGARWVGLHGAESAVRYALASLAEQE